MQTCEWLCAKPWKGGGASQFDPGRGERSASGNDETSADHKTGGVGLKGSRKGGKRFRPRHSVHVARYAFRHNCGMDTRTPQGTGCSGLESRLSERRPLRLVRTAKTTGTPMVRGNEGILEHRREQTAQRRDPGNRS